MILSFNLLIKKVVLPLFVISLLSSCYYDNLDELHPSAGLEPCDTTGTISYATDIVPILNANCGTNNSCHNGAAPFPLDTYSGVIDQVNSDNLILAITHDPSFTAAQWMPSGGGFINTCSINKIRAWINRGALEN